MKVKKLKNIGLSIIATIFVGNVAYSQNTNMALPSQVGVYNPNIKTQQMQLPPQVGVYNPNIPTQQMKLPPQTGVYQQQARYPVAPTNYRNMPVVNYNRDPVISENLYDEVNGYKTPNRYTLNQPKIIKTAYNNYGNKTVQQLANNSNDFGVEYYLALNYGVASFDDESGMSGNTTAINQFDLYYNFPLNNIKHSPGDGKNFSIGFGVMANRKQKVEISYSNISGLSYGDYATAENQWCPSEFDEDGNFYYDCSKDLPVEGGKITSNTFGLNVYFPIEELFGGKLFDGLITPYIGGGIGITFNTVDDYTVYDSIGNGEAPLTGDGEPYYNSEDRTPCTAQDFESNSNCVETWGYYDYDGVISHYGATTNNISWNLEAGLSFDLDSKTILDVYFKHNNLGKIKSSNEVFSSYATVDILDATETKNQGSGAYSGIEDYCTTEAINAGFYYDEASGWCVTDEYTTEQIIYDAGEKGTLENNEIGVKLRLIF